MPFTLPSSLGTRLRRLLLQNVEALQQAGAMSLLRPLLLDNVPRYAPYFLERLDLTLTWYVATAAHPPNVHQSTLHVLTLLLCL